MGPLLSLFGGDNAVLTVLIALIVVVALIIFGVWALKLVFNATGRASRGRAKRLAVVDASPVDQKRQLVLIRRDNVEHLLLIGGSQDIVVESNIFSGPAMGRPRPMQPAQQTQPAQQNQPSQQPQPGQQAPLPQQQQPAAPPPSAPTPAVGPAAQTWPARVRGTNLPPDLIASRGSQPGRHSMRHSPLLRPNERQEPEVIPSQPPRPSSPPADSDIKDEAEPVPNEAGAGSDQPDYRDEPQIDRDGDEQREAHKDS